MKHFWWMLAALLVLAGVLTAVVIAPRGRAWPDCTSRVVIGKGPRGEAVECVCIEGRLSTCFDPGL